MVVILLRKHPCTDFSMLPIFLQLPYLCTSEYMRHGLFSAVLGVVSSISVTGVPAKITYFYGPRFRLCLGHGHIQITY